VASWTSSRPVPDGLTFGIAAKLRRLRICFFRVRQVTVLSHKKNEQRNYTGDKMPRYISQHTLACLTRQGAEEISRRLLSGQPLAARRVVFNMQEGKMLVEFDAPGREDLEKWLAAGKFHFDWLLRIELEAAADGSLKPMA
jgi:hypothetical protein